MTDQDEIRIADRGRINIHYLKEIWHYYQQIKLNSAETKTVEWKYITGVFNALDIGIEPTIKYLLNYNNSFEQFENWIEENGKVSQPVIDQFNAIVNNECDIKTLPEEKVFSQTELEQWEQDGYNILKKAISKVDCQKTVDLVYDTINANEYDSNTWYVDHPLKQGIMVQLFNSTIIDSNRLSKKIQLAYRQLWNRNDLLPSMDRVSFNPPESESYKFPGPNLHWDVSLKRPIPFGLQGLLYLSNTDENQGAFTVVPGFHKNIEEWLSTLGEDQNPRDINLLSKFKKKPIAAEAGDLIIWHQCLPHGSSPNTSTKPRIVQYINYQPLSFEYQTEWI